MQISPNGTSEGNPNTAPTITSLQENPTANKGVGQIFTGSATDSPGTTLNYQWFWGDGTAPSGWSGSAGISHTYAKDGYYTAYFAVKEANTADGFITVKPVTVRVNDNSNTAPHNVAISYLPSNPDTGDTIAFTGSAIDDQGDPLVYSWNFGDTYTAAGATPTHRYTSAGSYSVTLSVTDNHVSTQPRPVTTSTLVAVTTNRAPTLTVPSYPYVGQNQLTMFTVTAADADGDALRFTWLWGDGGMSVTTTPYATHSYSQRRAYTLTVYADDLTGIAGHNVTGSNTVTVVTPTQHAPSIISFVATPTTVETGQAVTFTAVVTDQDGGVLRLTYNYGGGVYDVWNSASTLPSEQVTHSETNAFTSAGTKTVFLSVTDAGGQNTTITPGITVIVLPPNEEPIVSPLDPISSYTGATLSFNGDAFDPDNAVLRYTWSFGDGSALKVGQSVSYAYPKPGTFTVTLWVDDLTGLSGHNVSTMATATIGFRLSLALGWNLISLPMSTSYMASTLGLSSGDQVVQFDSATQTYKTHIVGLPLNNFAIAPSAGYWVYAASAKTLTLYGTVPTVQQSKAITVPAGGGWVLVGMCSMNTGWKAANLASMYSGSTMTTVVMWNSATQTYTTYVVGLPLNNFSLVPGQGYWIFVNGSGTLTYNP
jgi:PKD repeat protein